MQDWFILFSLSYLFKDFVFLYVLLSLNNCWFAHLLFWEDMQSIFFKKGLCPDYFNLKWFQLSDLCLTLPFTICCFEIYHGPLKGILKGHSVHAFASKQSVTPNYWGQCGKNHFLGTDETMTYNQPINLPSSSTEH